MLTKKVGPLPLFAWAILAGGAMFLLLKRGGSSASSSPVSAAGVSDVPPGGGGGGGSTGGPPRTTDSTPVAVTTPAPAPVDGGVVATPSPINAGSGPGTPAARAAAVIDATVGKVLTAATPAQLANNSAAADAHLLGTTQIGGGTTYVYDQPVPVGGFGGSAPAAAAAPSGIPANAVVNTPTIISNGQSFTLPPMSVSPIGGTASPVIGGHKGEVNIPDQSKRYGPSY